MATATADVGFDVIFHLTILFGIKQGEKRAPAELLSDPSQYKDDTHCSNGLEAPDEKETPTERRCQQPAIHTLKKGCPLAKLADAAKIYVYRTGHPSPPISLFAYAISFIDNMIMFTG
ncbi:hypothetical protein evm_013961 [Chilo suppressalis]|nr:hypothetical protein evm_013961 [Chilo suppressalis]